MLIDLIWVKRERKYFWEGGWTGESTEGVPAMSMTTTEIGPVFGVVSKLLTHAE
jgi:hypothetical protein